MGVVIAIIFMYKGFNKIVHENGYTMKMMLYVAQRMPKEQHTSSQRM